MFSDEILERIFAKPEVQKIPCSYQSTIIHAVEDVLEEMGVNLDDAVYEPKS